MRFRELVLNDPAGGEAFVSARTRTLTVLSGLPGPARQELIETFVTAAAAGRDDRPSLTTEDGPRRRVAHGSRRG